MHALGAVLVAALLVVRATGQGSTLPIPVTSLPCGLSWSDVFARFPQLSIKQAVMAAHPQILEMIPPPDANLSTIFAVTDAAYAAIDSDTTMAAFRAGNASGLDLASLEARLPLPKAASMWLFRSLQRPYSLDDLRGLTSVPTALAAATGDARYRLYFTPINLRGSVRSVVIDDLLMTVSATPVVGSVQACGSWLHMIDTYLWPATTFNVSSLPDPVPNGRYITAAPGTGAADYPRRGPIPASADLFSAAAAAKMPVPYAAARTRRVVAAGVGTAAAVILLALCSFAGFAGTRAWRRSREAAERAGCERGLAIGMSTATGDSSGPGAPHHGLDGWPGTGGGKAAAGSGHDGGLGGTAREGGPAAPGGGGVALSGALAALAAARGADGPTTAEEGEFLTGDTLAAALSGGGRGALGGGRGSGSGAAAAADRDAPAPDDWAACLAAELGPTGWALDGGAVHILTAPDGRPRRLGEGGFGAVYLAEMDGSTQVAVKLLSTQQPREVRRFIGEAVILKGLRHVNIVQFLGAFCGAGGAVALVTEYLPRGDLYRLLGRDFDRQYAWWRRGRGVALDIARGVLYMHTRAPPIIHLDLKSANVLLARDFTAKIADVGLAKVLSRADTKVSLEGTFDYAAPELLSGERVSEKADVYSMGVVLWELVTGESPRNRQLRHVVAGDAPPAECPAAVAAVIEACRARDPASRPTARELFDILVATPAVPRPSGAAGAASGGGGGGTGGTSGEGPASTPTPSPATGDASAGPTTGASGGLATASAASAASGGVGGGGGSGRSRAPPSAFG